MAERGAVMGREFWDSALEALAPEAASPARRSRRLARRDLVTQRAAPTARRRRVADALAASSPRRPHAVQLHDTRCCATPSTSRCRSSAGPICMSDSQRLLEELGAAGRARRLPPRAGCTAPLRTAPARARRLAERAAEHLERAGERALARRDDGAARALLTRAAALLDDDEAAATADRGEPRRQAGARRAEGSSSRRRRRPATGSGHRRARRDGRRLSRRGPRARPAGRPEGDRTRRSHGIRAFAQRFARESRIAARLEHPHVVPSTGPVRSRPALIAMRFVEGTDLAAARCDCGWARSRAGGQPVARSRRPSTPHTPAASSTATSSPRTSW